MNGVETRGAPTHVGVRLPQRTSMRTPQLRRSGMNAYPQHVIRRRLNNARGYPHYAFASPGVSRWQVLNRNLAAWIGALGFVEFTKATSSEVVPSHDAPEEQDMMPITCATVVTTQSTTTTVAFLTAVRRDKLSTEKSP